MALFSTAYWAPISYYQIAAQSDFVHIELFERYQKQSYRNRCIVLSANGPLSLVIPILRPHDGFIRDIRIDYSKPWMQTHWRAIEAAYRSSAYFEEFAPEISQVYNKEHPFLLDFNTKVWELSLTLLGASIPWGFTERFTPPSNNSDDYRSAIHPKAKNKPDNLTLQPYFQVFAHKYGFVPDVSILDLICNNYNSFRDKPLYSI